MELPIKNAVARKLAGALAQARGESMTDAVIATLRERLARVHSSSDTAERAKRLLAIGRAGSRDMRRLKIDHAELLYDDRGIPK
jgi:antitoxin VapB